MACFFPVGTYRKDGSLCFRPCGQCVGCRLDHAKEWAIRCSHEAQMHEENCFITLTYNDENLPKDRSIQKKVIQNFLKKLRKSLSPKQIRYFACGEYGEQTKRPHYHICLFGHDFEDKEVLHYDSKRYRKTWSSGTDHTLYTSESLEKMWGNGFVTIGELTFESAGYVARYCMKKISGSTPQAHQMRKEKYGDSLQPEFALMSRMPGIGKEWIEKYWSDVYPKDFLTIKGIKMQPPRYYDSVYKRKNPESFEKIKAARIVKQDEIDQEEIRETYSKLRHKQHVTKRLERSV